MAAGVGEASAILTIAQLGISLSNSLISYIGEVQDAPFRIQRISNEVATTCERLRDIGQLVDKNHETHIFSQEGIHSAVRSSEECHKIIDEIKTVLQKGGWQEGSGALERDEIDTSLFSTLRWPFLKRSLEVPRAELQRIKVDLSLLFSSAMALGASNAADKAKFCMDIPGLQKTKEWAARMETRARQRAQDRHPDYPLRGSADDMYRVDDEPEVLQEFVVYQERRMREDEDRRAMARAALLQAEQENKTKIEEEARREIEREVVNAYKRNQKDLQTRTQERKENFRNELSRLGLQPSQINLIVDDSNLNFGDNGTDAAAPTIPPIAPRILSSGSTVIQSHGEIVEDNKENSATPSTRGWGRRKFSWRRLRKTDNRSHYQEPSLNYFPSDKDSAPNHSLVLETWLLDVYSNWKLKIEPQATLLEAKTRQKNKGPDVWRCFAGLKPPWRTAILDLIGSRNRDGSFEWGLYSFGVLQRGSTLKIMRHKDDGQLLQVVLFRQEHSSHENFAEQEGKTNQTNATWMTPRTISRPSNLKRIQAQNDFLPQQSSAQVQPKVTFASEVDQVLKNVPTARSSRNLRRFRNAEEMKEAIVKLEQTKRELGPADEDRIDEINDMITLLAAQYKLYRTLSWSQQEYWYNHLEKDLPFGLLDDHIPKQAARRPKTGKKTRGIESAGRIQIEENGLRSNRNRSLRRDDRNLSVVSRNDEQYPLFEDGNLFSTHETRSKSAIPEGTSNVIERSNTRRSWENSRPQMSHYTKNDYGLSSPERSTTLQTEGGEMIIIPSQLPPRQEQLRPSRDQRAVDNSRTGDDTQHILTPGITRASTFSDDWERPANENRALVLRKGGSHQALGEVLDRSIRVRGGNVTQRPRDESYSATSYGVPESTSSNYAARSLPYVSRQATMESEPATVGRYGQSENGYSSKAHFERGGRKPLHREIERVKNRERRRRSPRHGFSSTSSDDDDYPPFRERSSSRSESKLSDQQLITKTLQKYTTFQSDKLPVIETSSEPNPPRDAPLRSMPKDHWGLDALSGETQDASAGAPSQSVPSKPDAVTTTGETFSGTITGLDLSYVNTDPRIFLSRNGIPPPPSTIHWRPMGAELDLGPSNQNREVERHRGDDGETTLPAFNPPRRTSRGDGNHLYPPVPLNRRHADGNQGNLAIETSIQITSETGAREAGEAGQGDASREPRITEVSDASSDASGRRRLRRQDRRATIEDAESDQD